jgi:hypothetical protein
MEERVLSAASFEFHSGKAREIRRDSRGVDAVRVPMRPIAPTPDVDQGLEL